MPRHAATVASSEIRSFRLRLQLSQPQFAKLLEVSAETYRTWDSGRRPMPDAWLERARALATTRDPCRLMSLQDLATALGVHVRTLRDAVSNGRLSVTYANRVAFRNMVPRATMAAGRAFIQRYYRQSYSRFSYKPERPQLTNVPDNYDERLRQIRRRLHLTQVGLATPLLARFRVSDSSLAHGDVLLAVEI